MKGKWESIRDIRWEVVSWGAVKGCTLQVCRLKVISYRLRVAVAITDNLLYNY